MTEPITKRCNAKERQHFRRNWTDHDRWGRKLPDTEPCLGSLEERLDIIYRRQGGKTRVVLTRAERAELEQAREAS